MLSYSFSLSLSPSLSLANAHVHTQARIRARATYPRLSRILLNTPLPLCSYSVAPPLFLCLPEDLSQATGYKMATVATEHGIEWHYAAATSLIPPYLWFVPSIPVPSIFVSPAVFT